VPILNDEAIAPDGILDTAFPVCSSTTHLFERSLSQIMWVISPWELRLGPGHIQPGMMPQFPASLFCEWLYPQLDDPSAVLLDEHI
jgi:hypothetical protein